MLSWVMRWIRLTSGAASQPSTSEWIPGSGLCHRHVGGSEGVCMWVGCKFAAGRLWRVHMHAWADVGDGAHKVDIGRCFTAIDK